MTAFVVSCEDRSALRCDYAAYAYTVKGPLLERHGSVATYVIDTLWRTQGGFQQPPELAVGQRVDVHYQRERAQFLRVGLRYQVRLWWQPDSGFFSDVHVADEACSTGTTYAGGSAIDTSLWSRSWVRNGVYVAGAVLLLIVIVVMTHRLTRRRRRPAASR